MEEQGYSAMEYLDFWAHRRYQVIKKIKKYRRYQVIKKKNRRYQVINRLSNTYYSYFTDVVNFISIHMYVLFCICFHSGGRATRFTVPCFHHTYYVTSSYILCHIIIHTMSHHQQATRFTVPCFCFPLQHLAFCFSGVCVPTNLVKCLRPNVQTRTHTHTHTHTHPHNTHTHNTQTHTQHTHTHTHTHAHTHTTHTHTHTKYTYTNIHSAHMY